MIRFRTTASDDSEAWLEAAEAEDINVCVTPIFEALAVAPLPPVSIAGVNLGKLKHGSWIGAPMPCCFEEGIDSEEANDAQADAYVLDIDYAPAVYRAVQEHGGKWIYAISPTNYHGFVNRTYNKTLKDTAFYRWSSMQMLHKNALSVDPGWSAYKLFPRVFTDDTAKWMMIVDMEDRCVLVGAPEFMATVFEGIPGGEAGLRRRGNDWQRYYADIKNPDPVGMSAAYEALHIRPISPPEDATPHQRAAILWPFEVIDDPITFR